MNSVDGLQEIKAADGGGWGVRCEQKRTTATEQLYDTDTSPAVAAAEMCQSSWSQRSEELDNL